jgi:hypothetical protein
MAKQITRVALAFVVAASLSGLGFAREHEHAQENRGMQTPLQYGYHNGYLDGFQHGREDRQAGVGYSFVSRDYDNAMRGYDSYMGSDHEYREGYREGYRAGYNDGFHGRSARFMGPSDDDAYGQEAQYRGDGDHYGPGVASGSGSVASRVGYEDGLIDGGKDRRKHKDFRPSKHDRYKDADHGYSHDYGNKKDYKREYREGYLSGYQRGFGDLQGARIR